MLPRAHAALEVDGWNPSVAEGVRLLGEVAMDELALSGMTLTAPPPRLERTAESWRLPRELSTLGVAGAHGEARTLRVNAIRGNDSVGRLVYERLTFEQIRVAAAVAGAARGSRGPGHRCGPPVPIRR